MSYKEVIQRSGYSRVVFDELTVISDEPRKAQISLTVFGIAKVFMASVFSESVSIPFFDTTKPSYVTRDFINSHLSALSFRLWENCLQMLFVVEKMMTSSR